MADNRWENNDLDNDGNNPNNWSQGRVPTNADGDNMEFTPGSSNDDCIFTSNVDCAGFEMNASYTGDVKFQSGAGVTCHGELILSGGSGRIDFGSGTHEFKSTMQFSTSTAFTLNFESSTVICSSSTAANFTWANGDTINGSCLFRISGDYNMVANDTINVTGTATFEIASGGTFTMASNMPIDAESGATIDIKSGGTLETGTFGAVNVRDGGTFKLDGTLLLAGSADLYIDHGGTWSSFTGSITTSGANQSVQFQGDCTLPGGTWTIPVEAKFDNRTQQNDTLTWPSCTATFEANVIMEESYTFGGYTYTWDMSVNSPTLKFEADLEFDLIGGSGDDGKLKWIPGTNAIQFTGNSAIKNSNVDPGEEWRVPGGGYGKKSAETPSLGDITVIGDLELQREVYCDDINFNSGTQTDGLDLNGHELIAHGDVTFNSGYDGGTFAGNGGRLYCGGDLTLDGQTFTASAEWIMSARNSIVWNGAGDIQYCRVPGINTYAPAGWTDSGNNKGITFAAAPDKYTTHNVWDD